MAVSPLLDVASLGGADHHTPLFETPPVAKPGEKHSGMASRCGQDKDGTVWVFASVSSGITLNDSASSCMVPLRTGDRRIQT